MPSTEKNLREEVTRALLRTQDPEISERYDLSSLWSTPLPYEEVRDVVNAYERRDQLAETTVSGAGIRLIGYLVVTLALLVAVTLGVLALMFRRRISVETTQASPDTQQVPVAPSDPEHAEDLARFQSLTRREREVLELICEGQPSKLIAQNLGISPKTVDYHRANLLQKTEAGSSAHLVQLATRLGFDQGISPGESQQ